MNFLEETAGNAYFASRGAWVVCSMYHGVCIGLWKGDRFIFHESAEFLPDCVTELRVFDARAELRFVRDGAGLKARYICDDGAEDNVYDTKYLMFGTDVAASETDENGVTWSCLREERGGVLWFPKDTPRGAVLWLEIRNYLRYNPVYIGEDDSLRQTGRPALEAVDYRYKAFWTGLADEAEGTADKEVLL